MKSFRKSLAVVLSLLMLVSLLVVSPAGVSAAEETLPGTFVLVHDKGDIGTFGADGTITYTATADDYVWVRNYDTGVQYCTDGWQGFVTSTTLVNERAAKQFNKLYVPKGTQTLTLVYNGDDTFTLSYGDIEPTEPKPTTPQPTEPKPTHSGSLSGNFVLVHDKGDIGYFDEYGTITYTATADDYVWVRNYDTGVQYCTDGWQGFVETVTLVNEKVAKQFNKLYVPAGTNTFTLIDNGNDTFTLSYGDIEPTEPQPTTAQQTTAQPTAPQPTEPKPTHSGSLSGNFVLVSDKGDIGYFDENGTITYTATADDYVWVRNYDTGVQYCTDGWQGFVETVTLVNEKVAKQFNKLYVPAGTNTFTLIDNGNDTFTLSYGDIEPTEPQPTTPQPTTQPDVTDTRFMFVGDKDTSASALYDSYSSMFKITADSSDTSVATIVIDPKADKSVTLTAIKVGETIITVYANGNVYQRYRLIVKEKTQGGLNGTFVLVHDKGDIGVFDENGKLTFTATADDYVWIRNYDTGVQYCTDGWQGFVDTVTLVNEAVTTQFNKLYIPAGEHTLTLIDNGDDTFTLSYGNITPQPTTPQPTTPQPTEPAEDSGLKLVVLGDSIAAGYGLSSADDSYASIVAKAKGYELQNLAVSGHESADLLRLLQNDSKVMSGVESADIISISIGGNDFLHNLSEVIKELTVNGADSEYVRNIRANLGRNLSDIIAEIRKHNPDAVIILQTVYNPLSIRNVYGITAIAQLEQGYVAFNQVFNTIAQSNENVYVADVYTAFAENYAVNKDSSIIQADGIHPSVSGHKIISEVLLDEIDELISQGVIPEKKEDTVTYLVGDSNGDGKVDINDATTIQKYAAELIELDDIRMLAADVDGNGKVNVADVTTIQKFLTGQATDSEINQQKTIKK